MAALPDETVKEKLSAFRGWEMLDGQLQKTYSFSTFMAALDLVNKVALVAEHQDHHPDILIKYSKVTFMLATKSEGGITDKDFKMVKEIEQLATLSV
jgi:4a-hydroxytetrahydrobiopterin dehydratase